MPKSFKLCLAHPCTSLPLALRTLAAMRMPSVTAGYGGACYS